MLSRMGKPLPRNVVGGSYSIYVEFGSGVRQGCTEGAAARVHALTARLRPARAWRGLGGQLMPYAGVRGILGGVRAPAPSEALAPRQAQLASVLDPAVNQALAVSTPQAAGSGLSAARSCGTVRWCASTARSARREPTTVTVAGQGLRTQVPRHSACLHASRPGWSRAASGSVTPSEGSPVL